MSEPALLFLERSLVPAADVLAWGTRLHLLGRVSADEADVARELAVGVVELSARKNISYWMRYNIACFWSTWLDRVPGEYDLAGEDGPQVQGLRQLTAAVTDAPPEASSRLAEWAITGDPSLRPLREAYPPAFARAVSGR